MMLQKRNRWSYLLSLGLALTTSSLAAGLADDRRSLSIQLRDTAGESISIGQLHLSGGPESYTYQVAWDETLFNDHFLSMRPFKCLEGPKYWLCHLPYGYPIQRQISKADLTDLEYDLLFIRKLPSEFGIDAWNGVYYRLNWQEDGLQGELHEVDLNLLAIPPAEGDFRPIGAMDLTPGDPQTHWLPEMLIR
jgi:hypothetical protein